MVDVNNISISGRVYKPPREVEEESGKQRAVFTIAVERWGGKGNAPESDFFRVDAKGSLAKYVLKSLDQGDNVFLNGCLRIMHYAERETGQVRELIYISAKECKLSKSGY